MARMRLHKFLCEAQAEGLRTVLVITGKEEIALYSTHIARHWPFPLAGARRSSPALSAGMAS